MPIAPHDRPRLGWAISAAAAFVLLTIWLRPGPAVLYGVDAGCYARVAAELAARPMGRWIEPLLGGQGFYEHPPGLPLLEAVAFRLTGASVTTALGLARVMATLVAWGVAQVAHQVAGQRAVLGTLLLLPAMSSFLYESQNPMLEMPLCAGLLLALLGALKLAKSAWLGTALFTAGVTIAWWSKGPPAFAAWGLLAFVCWRGHVRLTLALGAAASGVVSVVASMAWFEHARRAAALPPFFAVWWQHQVMASVTEGRHNPIASLWYYAPIVWRWQTAGVVLAPLLLFAVWQRRRQFAEATFLAQLGLVWGLILFVGFSVVRQKYQWYLHPMFAGFAWLGGAALVCWTTAHRWLPRIVPKALITMCVVYGACVAWWPERLQSRQHDLEALQALPPPQFDPGHSRDVAYCGPTLGWRAEHYAKFLWQANIVACDAPAPFRLAHGALEPVEKNAPDALR